MPELPPIHRWEIASPRGLVHIVHGMAEYGARYGRLAAALNDAGYAVWAHDHRGHGAHQETGGQGHFGDEGGWEALVTEAHATTLALRAAHPGVPLVLFAHSMGSFVGQTLIGRYGRDYDAAVLCGSNGPPGALEDVGRLLARAERRLRGPRTPSRWVQQAVFGTYNRGISPVRTDMDWLSRDPAEVDAYIADPLCGFPLTTQAWVDFLEGKAVLGQDALLRGIPVGLPVHLIAGDRDPVGERGRGVRRLYDAYVGAGLTRVSLRLYPGARHELVNETNRDEVTADLIAWLDGVTK
ncbi:hypothetical protein TBR22_A11290 [Luteitalea sp. TBR-22]|uniref:alpha/beta hydrolase n=1 Tax=Luteitalea sp. TBR-22 TaxID=2802971 RepID=UPI001AF55D7B|nr:alpha/beta hydrolase [Luteitalea sp. TBR-22]BCS31926.1 hypothetical protein TBR22_A11290 [Luteitalea sp. TBR-22]